MKGSLPISHLLLGATLVFACCCNEYEKSQGKIDDAGPFNDSGVEEGYVYSVPADREDGWEVGHAQDHGFDVKALEALVDELAATDFSGIHSINIAKDGVLVFDEYFPGYDSMAQVQYESWDDLHNIMSCTKSVASSLVGLAVDKGQLESVLDLAKPLFVDHQDADWSGQKADITVRDLLTMTPGYQWDELSVSYLHPDSPVQEWADSPDPIRYTLDLPLAQSPGTHFTYNSGVTNLLGEVIRGSTGTDPEVLAEEIMEPLGIEEYEFNFMGLNQKVALAGGLRMRLRDMTKFGQLYCNGGSWKEKQVLSADWVTQSLSKKVEADSGGIDGYGYQWWVITIPGEDGGFEIPFAMGFGGQFIFVIRELDMVVTFFSGNYQESDYATPCFEVLSRIFEAL